MGNKFIIFIAVIFVISSCQRLGRVGKIPDFNPIESSNEFFAMNSIPMPQRLETSSPAKKASLWTGDRSSLLGDKRAAGRGDIVTVVVEINDKAEISNSSSRTRAGYDTMGIPQMFGIPQRIDRRLPDGASMGRAYETLGTSSYQGDGEISRKEKLTLRVAATVLDSLPNGVLRIQGSQEVRVNYEIRELILSGFVRSEDVSRKNEITYDKLAGARIAYGGRGQITDVQQPRYGQQIADVFLPF